MAFVLRIAASTFSGTFISGLLGIEHGEAVMSPPSAPDALGKFWQARQQERQPSGHVSAEFTSPSCPAGAQLPTSRRASRTRPLVSLGIVTGLRIRSYTNAATATVVFLLMLAVQVLALKVSFLPGIAHG